MQTAITCRPADLIPNELGKIESEMRAMEAAG